MEWNLIWHQAMTPASEGGRVQADRTTKFSFPVWQSGSKVRLRFRNQYGTLPYDIGGIALRGSGGV